VTSTPSTAASTCSGKHRAVATRHDKLAVRYEATIHIAAIKIWLRDPWNTP
jgi:transposase